GTWNTDNSEWKTVSKIRIENLTLENYRRFGIAIENSEFIYVHNNTMKNATSLGVGGEGYGLQISMDKSKNNWIKGNTVGPVIRNGLLVQFDANHNLFEENTISGTTHDAFDMHGEGEYSNEFRNNTISGCLSTDPYTGATTYGSGFGVGEVPTTTSFPPGDAGHHDFSGDNNWIHHNTITGCYSGIRINNTSYAYIENNTITNNRAGGILIGDLDSYIFPELASNPPPYGTNYITVRNNTVKNNPVGVKMNNAKNAKILDNIVTNNTGAGLTLTAQTTGYTITGNDFKFNGSTINLGGNTSGVFTNNLQ
nr:right-handed parallel beta-helix repeat-containing protein [Candidatus Levybacteria bacterium]